MGLVSKETVVPLRWGSEKKRKFAIKPVDKGQINNVGR